MVKRKTKMIASKAIAATLIGLSALTGVARADLIVLKDLNSTVNINTGSDQGMFDWIVDSVDQLKRQWFWYRTGNGDFESPINTLIQKSIETSRVPLFNQPDDNRLKVVYGDQADTFEISVTITLTGGNPGDQTSTISEDIRIKNLSNAPLSFSFFQMTDFDVLGTTAGDTVSIVNPNFNTARQTEGIGNISDAVVTPAPTHFTVGEAAAILAALNDASVTVLDDNAGPVTPADAAWAYEWDRVLAPIGQLGNTLQISLKKTVSYTDNPQIPEPTAAALMGLAGMALLRRRSR
jgi:hypothetical protein